MDKILERKIISEYKKGVGSTTISKITGIQKKKILTILNNHNLIRKRDRCKSLDIKQDGEKYYITRNCPKCGREIKTTSKDKIVACRNYFNSVNGNCKCPKCVSDSLSGEGNPFYGKKHKQESIDKISKSRVGKGVGEKNSMNNPKWRKKASENLNKKWRDGKMEHARKIMSDKIKETRRLGKIKSTITSKAEKNIIEELMTIGYNPIHSFRVDTKICDIFIPKLNLIIEYFGDYWHCNPNKYDSNYFNEKKGKFAWELWEYDRKKLEIIKSYGYNLEVIWETDYKSDKSIIKNIITKYDTNIRISPEPSRTD